MPLSTDVNLPKSHTAKFPDKCVVCGCPSPGNLVKLMTGSIGWWTWTFWVFGKPFSVKAPSCRLCGWRLHLQRLAGLLLSILLIYTAYVFLWPLVDRQIPLAFRKWILFGLAILCLAPQILFELFVPSPFSITAYGDNVDYEFSDEYQAHEFAELNQDAEWCRIE